MSGETTAPSPVESASFLRQLAHRSCRNFQAARMITSVVDFCKMPAVLNSLLDHGEPQVRARGGWRCELSVQFELACIVEHRGMVKVVRCIPADTIFTLSHDIGRPAHVTLAIHSFCERLATTPASLQEAEFYSLAGCRPADLPLNSSRDLCMLQTSAPASVSHESYTRNHSMPPY